MSEKRIALVTGASRGIGMAIARMLADAGFDIVGTATSAVGTQKLEEALGGSGALRAALELDVTDQSSIESFFESLRERELRRQSLT